MAAELHRIGEYDGGEMLEATLVSESGVRIAVMSYGAAIRDWQVPVAGTMRPVVLGFDRFEDYPDHSPYFGAIVGRVANRIGGARFTLNGREHQLRANEGPNHLHGGPKGFASRLWNVEPLAGEALRLTLVSPDGDMGYPGRLDVSVTYRLTGNTLRIDFVASADAPTPVNIVQHNYFNLMGEGVIRDHRLQVASSAYTVVDDALIPTGEIRPVAGTNLDFRTPRPFGDETGNTTVYDDNLVLDTGRDLSRPAAAVTAPDGSLTLKLRTDQPALQVYSGGRLDLKEPGLGGRIYPRFGGFCLEDQNFPDAVNNPHFPSPIVTPERPYTHWCEIEIG